MLAPYGSQQGQAGEQPCAAGKSEREIRDAMFGDERTVYSRAVLQPISHRCGGFDVRSTGSIGPAKIGTGH